MIEAMVTLKQMIGDLNLRLDELEKPLGSLPHLKRLISGQQNDEMEEEREEQKVEEDDEDAEIKESVRDSPPLGFRVEQR